MSSPHRRAPDARLPRNAPGRDAPPPRQPILIEPNATSAFKFASIDELGAAIQERRALRLGKPGLRLRPLQIGWGGYRTFPGFTCYWLFGDDETYAFTVAADGCAQETLEAAIRRAEPKPAARRMGAGEAARPEDLLILDPIDEAA